MGILILGKEGYGEGRGGGGGRVYVSIFTLPLRGASAVDVAATVNRAFTSSAASE